MQATGEKMLFLSENYQYMEHGTTWPICAESAVKPQPTNQPTKYMEQVASQCCGGFLR